MRYFEDPKNSYVQEVENLLDFNNNTLPNKNDIWTEDSVTSAGKIICVLLLRIGFILVQVGSIPVENVYIIIFRNIIEIATAIISYGFIGFHFSFGIKSFYGLINYDGFIGNKDADLSYAALGFSACLIGTAITSSLLVARLCQLPMLIITFITCAAFQPMLMCWCWSKHGWMTKFHILDKRVAIKDYGGNLVIHVPTATIGLIGALLLGRRIMKVSEIDRFSLGNEYISGTITGYFFIIIGHIGFNLPSKGYESQHVLKDYISHISVNCLMAMGAGILVVSLLQILITRDVYKYWIMVKCLQGGLAGVVTVTSGIDIYSPIINFGIAASGTLLFFVSSNLIHYTALEDCCNVVAIYLICGSIGSLAPSLFGSEENLGTSVSVEHRMIHLLWQFICLIIIFFAAALLYLIIFAILCVTSKFQNSFEKANHKRAKILHKRVPWKRYFDRIFLISNKSKEISPELNRTEMSQVFTT